MDRRIIDRFIRVHSTTTADVFFAYVALISVILVVAELTLELEGDMLRTLYIADALTVALLIIDFILRALESGSMRRYIVKHFYEIPALIPLVLLVQVEQGLVDLGLIRLVRFLRLLRLLMVFSRSSRLLTLFREVIIDMRIGDFFLVVILTLFAGSIAVYFAEATHPDSPIKTYGDAFWWAMATATTVGYGDVVPVTAVGRAIGVLMMILGIGLVGAFISSIGAAFYEYVHERSGSEAIESIKKRIDNIYALSEDELEQLIDDIRREWLQSRSNHT